MLRMSNEKYSKRECCCTICLNLRYYQRTMGRKRKPSILRSLGLDYLVVSELERPLVGNVGGDISTLVRDSRSDPIGNAGYKSYQASDAQTPPRRMKYEHPIRQPEQPVKSENTLTIGARHLAVYIDVERLVQSGLQGKDIESDGVYQDGWIDERRWATNLFNAMAVRSGSEVTYEAATVAMAGLMHLATRAREREIARARANQG